MVLVLVITLATCNTGTGFSLVKAEEIVETKEKTEVGSNVNNEGYCEPEVVEEIVSDRTTDSTTFLLSNGMKQTTYYSDDIYFENEKGQLSEYDNEFVKLDKSDKKQVVDSVEVKGTEKEKYSSTCGISKPIYNPSNAYLSCVSSYPNMYRKASQRLT